MKTKPPPLTPAQSDQLRAAIVVQPSLEAESAPGLLLSTVAGLEGLPQPIPAAQVSASAAHASFMRRSIGDPRGRWAGKMRPGCRSFGT